MARRIVFLLALLLFAVQGVETALALTIAPPTGHVNDRAGILDAATVKQLESFLADFEKSDSTQIVVLTVPNLGGQPLEAFSLAVAEQWGVGQKGKDNGALLLVARDERRIRIEVGYGLEGRLTDLTAGQIIRNVITPAFRQGNFDLGVTRGVQAMVAAVKGEYKAGSSGAGKIVKVNHDNMLIFLVFGLFMIGRIFGRRKPLAAVAGGGFAFCLGWMFFGLVGALLLLLTLAGAIGGFLAAALAPLRAVQGNPFGRGGGYGGSFGGFGGGGGFSGGGFSGGGGGFGGGGASGGW